MGGVGSGNWSRWDKKKTTDQVKRIDIHFMRKKGLLKPNSVGNLNWSLRGQPHGCINYICHKDSLQLSFRYRIREGNWQSEEQHIHFDRTACHFGGDRLWFLCPSCNTRIGVLYGAGTLFLCRHCHQLSYSSQNSSEIDNLVEQKHKLGERIFEPSEGQQGWCKKKGMHWKTFHRLHAQYMNLEKRWYKCMEKNIPGFRSKGL